MSSLCSTLLWSKEQSQSSQPWCVTSFCLCWFWPSSCSTLQTEQNFHHFGFWWLLMSAQAQTRIRRPRAAGLSLKLTLLKISLFRKSLLIQTTTLCVTLLPCGADFDHLQCEQRAWAKQWREESCTLALTCLAHTFLSQETPILVFCHHVCLPLWWTCLDLASGF